MYERTKAPKKGENQEQNGRTHAQEGKWTTQEGEPQGENPVPKPPLVTRSISKKERGKTLYLNSSTQNLNGFYNF
jgi:hypothetical protein